MRHATLILLVLGVAAAGPAAAATWGELSNGGAVRPAAYAPNGSAATPGCAPCQPTSPAWGGGSAGGPGWGYGAPSGWTGGPVSSWGGAVPPSPWGGAASGPTLGGSPPVPFDAPGTAAMPPGWSTPPEALLPMRDGGLPNGPVQLWTFGQINNSTDPYNAWGLSTPFMFVPWSTPLSGWTNAQTWNWWRTRSGVRSPAW